MDDVKGGIIYDKSPLPPSQTLEKATLDAARDAGKAFGDSRNKSGGSEGSQMDYSSTPLGLEEIFVEEPPGVYPNSPGARINMKLKDAADFIGEAVRKGFESGNYSVVEHYAKMAEQSPCVDEALLPQIKDFAEEARKLTNEVEAGAFLEKFNAFLGELRLIKRK